MKLMRRSKDPKIKRITRVLVIILVLYSVVMVLQKIIWKDKIPSIFGFKNFVVLSGSMEPKLKIGDIIIVRETQKIKEGDIISFKEKNSVVTHRIIKIINEDGEEFFQTKGDANSAIDIDLVKRDAIEGKYCFKIPFLGNLVLLLKNEMAVYIFGGIIILLLIVINVRPLVIKGKHG